MFIVLALGIIDTFDICGIAEYANNDTYAMCQFI